MNILITETDNIDEFMESDVFKSFDNGVNEYKQKIEREHLDYLKNDTQKKILLDWCRGNCVSSEEYKLKNNITKEDDYEAHSAILSVISLGLGWGVSMNYHVSWLECAIVRLREDNTKVSAVNGDMTIEEFIREFCGEELGKVIKLE